MKRTHDKLYLNDNEKIIKEVFVKVADELALEPFETLADVGCAAGVFPNYLKFRFPKSKIVGIEYSKSLLSKAKKDFPEVEFYYGNAMDKNSIEKKFDVITLLGVLCIFDDYKLVLDNIFSWLKPNGRLIIHNMISEFNIDVIIKYKPSSLEYDKQDLESGWNILSNKSLESVVLNNNAKIVSSKPFYIKEKLKKQKDLLRSWTEKNLNNRNDIFNALHIRQPQRIVTIRKVK
tara:strand:- start:43 stop:741 length:699 start_codon:yes stop_codon:yes gene_type:complete